MEEDITIETLKLKLNEVCFEYGINKSELNDNTKAYIRWLITNETITERQLTLVTKMIKEK